MSVARSGDEALQLFEQFVQFSLGADQLDGRKLLAQPQWRERVQPDYLQYLRPDADLAAAHGERIRGETRLNADGTLDISKWARPQHDGIATRALTLMRWLQLPTLEPAVREAAARLLKADLALHPTPLARALLRHLGGGPGTSLLHPVRRGCGAAR